MRKIGIIVLIFVLALAISAPLFAADKETTQASGESRFTKAYARLDHWGKDEAEKVKDSGKSRSTALYEWFEGLSMSGTKEK